ncbi:MAG: PKD domain-containing protein [bacterium]|nr:PKD domain-containing protein [bacterium]
MTAQTQIPIPAHNRNYTGYSRGFSLVANTDFYVTKLDLPLDAQQPGDTASYLITVNGVEVLRNVGGAGAHTLAAPLSIKTGDLVLFVGNWSGAVTSMSSANNSYGSSAPYATLIAGVAHTLSRGGWQYDIGDPGYAVGGPGFTGNAGDIGRVLVYTMPPAGLLAGFSATPTSGVSPLAVTFTDGTFCSDPAGVQTWAWDFDGDGVVDSNLQNPVNTYGGGVFTVALTVTDTMHPASTETKVGYIEVDVVTAAFKALPASGASPLAVTFTDGSTGPIALYEWDFDNDGVIDSNVASPVYTYTMAGRYSVSLRTSNATSNATDLQVDLITVDPIVASFTASATAVNPGASVSFTDTSTGAITVWAWDFDGDGVVDSNLQHPSYVYAAAGIFTAELTVSNAVFSESASEVIGVGVIPMMPYLRTYSSRIQTRGYWFVAPVAFSITGLQVPDEAAHGLQNACVARVQGTSSTAVYDFLFEGLGQPSNQVMPCQASFAAGDTVYVLGACGDATVMHSSYDAAGGASSVLGQPITLTRAAYNGNIVSAPISAGGVTLGFETGGNVGRVRTVTSDASGVDYGVSSDNGNTLGAPTLTTTVLPMVGGTAEFSTTTFDAGDLSASLLVGIGRAGLLTPFGTINVGLIVLDVPVPAFVGAGTYQVPVAIPSTPALIGSNANFQAITLNPLAPSIFGMSNGAEWTIGSF